MDELSTTSDNQIDDDILTDRASDEALEAAAGTYLRCFPSDNGFSCRPPATLLDWDCVID